GYLPQVALCYAGESLLGSLERRTGVAAAAAELDALAARRGEEQERAEAHGAALDRFLALGGGDLEARGREVCTNLGLPAGRLGHPVGAVPGGGAAGGAGAAILLS